MLELEANEEAGYNLEDSEKIPEIEEESPAPWHLVFREQRQQIIELWDICQVSIIHRAQFYLLFKGDPADQIYMEVELRRLTWLQEHLSEIGNASPSPTQAGNESIVSLSSRSDLSLSLSKTSSSSYYLTIKSGCLTFTAICVVSISEH